MSTPTPTLAYLTLTYIKAHSRVDFDEEDDLLTLYGASAEATVMNLCNTSYEAMVSTYGEIPAPVMHATLMLVELAHTQRSPVSTASLYTVPYTFDLIIKPYVILADTEEESSSDI